MTAINFPASPTTGDTFVSGDVTYTWDGVKWTAKGADPGHVLKSGDTMTGNLTVPSLNGGPLAGFRNQIINGDFRIWQRGTDFLTPADLTYTADRWAVAYSSGRVLRTTDAPPGFNYAAALYTTSRQGLLQMVELDRVGHPGQFATNTTWTISFYLKGDVGAGSINVGIRFVDNLSGTNLVSLLPYTLTNYGNTWTRYSHTFTINAAPAATNTALNVTFDSQGGSPGANGTVAIAGIQLEPGPVATPFEHRPIGTELALCQRYYFQSNINFQSVTEAVCIPGTSLGFTFHVPFPVTMRAQPTEPVASLWKIRPNAGASPTNITAAKIFFTTGAWYGVQGGVATGTQLLALRAGTPSPAFDAEL